MIDHLKRQRYKRKHTIMMEYWNNISKKQNTKGKKKPFRIWKKSWSTYTYSTWITNREIKNRREIEQPSTKIINISVEDMDKFEENKIMKRRPFARNTWHD